MAVASFPKDMFFAYQLIRFGTPGTHNLHCPTTLVYLALYLDYQGDEGANLSALVDLLADLPTLQQFRMGDVGDPFASRPTFASLQYLLHSRLKQSRVAQRTLCWLRPIVEFAPTSSSCISTTFR